MNAIMRFAERYAIAVLLLLLAITAGFASQLPRLSFNASFDKMMLEGDANRARFEVFREVFGDTETVLLFLRDEDLMTAEHQRAIDAALVRIRALPFVAGVTSLFSLNEARMNENGEIESRPFLDATQPLEGAELTRWLARAVRDPLLSDQFMAGDGKGMAAIVSLAPVKADAELMGSARDAAVVAGIDQALEPLRETLDTVIQVGSANVRDAVHDKVVDDQQRILPLALGLLLVLLALILRRLNGALVPLLTGAMSVIWTLGAMALIGVELNVMTAIVPVLIIIVGSTEDIHLLAEYYAGRDEGLDKAAAIERMAGRVGMAVLLTFLTTALGFLSIAANPIAILREFGLMAGFGLAANFLVTILLVPAWLSLFGARARDGGADTGGTEAGGGREHDGPVQALAVWLMAWVCRRRIVVWVMTGVVLFASAVGAWQLKVDNNPLGYLGTAEPVSLDRAELERGLTGSHGFSIVFDAQIEGTFLKVKYLEELARVQRFLGDSGHFRKTFSFADIMAKVNVVMEEDDSGRFYLPEEDIIAREYALFLDHGDIAEYVSADFSRARITVRHTLAGSHELGRAIAEVEAYLAERAPRGVHWFITGHEIMTNHAADYMAVGQVASLALVFLVIWALVSLLFVNAQAGLIALVPNLIPVAVLFGVMGGFGIPLDTSTAMVAAIALGICVDDTMHFMVRFHRANQGRTEPLAALKDTVRHEAVPIFSTSLALAAGFGLLGLSGFPPVAWFGVLSALMMITALFATFLVTPLLLSSIRLVSLWDMFDLHLRDRVRDQCRLFADMRTWQIKKMILLGEVERFDAGQTLFAQGEEGDQMYVVLDGGVEIRVGDGPDQRAVALLGEGEVFGEMALIRSQPRSASAVATAPTQVLVLRWSDVQRIQRLYPRIASRLFLNLSRIMGDRLNQVLTA
ncbi:MAG: MMPL family transporter [Gammaproteobacteria bacterium]